VEKSGVTNEFLDRKEVKNQIVFPRQRRRNSCQPIFNQIKPKTKGDSPHSFFSSLQHPEHHPPSLTAYKSELLQRVKMNNRGSRHSSHNASNDCNPP
jgi:hypothetical protein